MAPTWKIQPTKKSQDEDSMYRQRNTKSMCNESIGKNKLGLQVATQYLVATKNNSFCRVTFQCAVLIPSLIFSLPAIPGQRRQQMPQGQQGWQSSPWSQQSLR
jgi:hypothetical protein